MEHGFANSPEALAHKLFDLCCPTSCKVFFEIWNERLLKASAQNVEWTVTCICYR